MPVINFLNNSSSLTICIHNSRVGQTTSACGNFCASSTSCNSGRPKAAVLPVPVCASPTRSFVPLNNTGIACSCMGVGCLNPKASVACTSLASKPSPSNVVIYCIKFAQRYVLKAVPPRPSCHPAPSAAEALAKGATPLFDDPFDLIRVIHQFLQIFIIL